MKALKIPTIFTAILTLALTYAPQPLAPALAKYFKTNLYEISWVMSVTLIPLAFAPIVYGYLLEKFSLKKILIYSLFFCALFQMIANSSDDFYFFLTFRFLQSLCIPAILTALLTLLTRIESENIQKNIALYVGATTLGGFIGRVFGSYLSDLFSWHFALNFFAFLMFICALVFCFFKDLSSNLNSNISVKDFMVYLSRNEFLVLLICVFVMFFSFQSIVSFLPFHLKESFINITQTQIGLVYLGFLTGILSSLLIQKTIKILKSKFNTAVFGFLVFIAGCLSMMITHFLWSFVSMFIFCSGMFICHCIFSALLNLKIHQKGLANGLYLTFYYSGGVMGSVIPGFYYEILGWNFLCIFTILLLLCALTLFLKFKKFYV
ncbi:MFS transporter [Campylobacter cuniculorum]|uniref:MFS transporter n=1 Tax=Campylobacter cuniculorum TaxID=374106 RepID=UPI0023F4813E|nr:MFS transporter [Campylobacter cuniculorum]